MLRDEMLTLVLCHKPKCHLKQHDDNSGSNREWQMALQKTGYRKVRSGLTISRRDSDYMTATYSGIDPELRSLSRAYTGRASYKRNYKPNFCVIVPMKVRRFRFTLSVPHASPGSLLGTSASDGRNLVNLISTLPSFRLIASASSTATSKNGGGLVRFFSMISRGMGINLRWTSSLASTS